MIFVATADEEAGGSYGAGWLVENRPEIFDDVGFLLNEGGGGEKVGDEVQFGVEVTQKVPVLVPPEDAWASPDTDRGPHVSSSVTEMIDALERLRAHEFEPRIIPAVDAHLKGIAARPARALAHPLPGHGRRTPPAGRPRGSCRSTTRASTR